jgi:hypothetical protein
MKQLLRPGSGLLLVLGLATPLAATHAQAPAWAQLATGTQATNVGTLASTTAAVATDASGNVFVTGGFFGTATFGSTVLTSKGSDQDFFVAKYVPATGTWAWAQRGGGVFSDAGAGLVVRGNTVYVVGTVNSGAGPGTTGITFGGTTDANSPVPVAGLSSFDILVAKYTDNGTSATLNWAQVANGPGNDTAAGLAVVGANLYVAGNSGNDWYLTKLTDAGSAATQGWAYSGGGSGTDRCFGVAANGPNVYLTGTIFNSSANANGVAFADAVSPYGVPANGASPTSSPDLALLKYVDGGATATLQWVQVAGGTYPDGGRAVAVSGNSVYVVGSITNNAANDCSVLLGGTGTAPGTVTQPGASPISSDDWLVAKYLDAGPTASLAWAQVAGGTRSDVAQGLALSGTSLFVTGATFNGAANLEGVVFGGTGATAGTLPLLGMSTLGSSSSPDLVVAKYLDNGPAATVQWAQVGGGPQPDTGAGITTSGQNIYAGGSVVAPASFGAFGVAVPLYASSNVLVRLVDRALVPLAVAPAGAAAAGGLFPNPAHGLATLTGAAAGAPVQVLDALGRAVVAGTADASGTARLALPAGLAPGVYVVRSGAQALRLAVE